jgi:hypothetical protein
MDTAVENEVEEDGGTAAESWGDVFADGVADCSFVALVAAEPLGPEVAAEVTATSGACVSDVGFALSFSDFVAAASLLPRRV